MTLQKVLKNAVTENYKAYVTELIGVYSPRTTEMEEPGDVDELFRISEKNEEEHWLFGMRKITKLYKEDVPCDEVMKSLDYRYWMEFYPAVTRTHIIHLYG